MTIYRKMTEIGGWASAIIGGASIGWLVPMPTFWWVMAIYCCVLFTISSLNERIKILEDHK